MSRQAGMAAIVVLQVAYLGASVAYHQLRVQGGTKVLLQTTPVDPKSIFRGRYVTLNYRISRLPASLVSGGTEGLDAGDALYVVLERRGEFWEAAGVHRRRPGGGTVLRGRLTSAPGKELWLRYGIETFFLSEDSADAIEARQREFARARWNPRRRDAWQETLGKEDRRIAGAGFLNHHWRKRLGEEMAHWERAGWVTAEQAAAISRHYEETEERIAAARRVREAEEPPTTPLTVEVSAGADGTGYPARLFWEGREYR
jgi:hypothetical protein